MRQWPEDHRVYLAHWDDLAINDDDLLCRRVRDDIGDTTYLLPCIPEAEHDPFVKYIHELGAHQGVKNTCFRALRVAYLPHCKAVAERVIRRCDECAQKAHGNPAQRHTLVSPQDSYPFQRIAVDFVGPLRRSSQGNRWILTVKDTFSRWVEAFPLPAATALAVVECLEKEIFCRFGVPETIHSDRGAQFTGRLLREVADELGVTLTTTPAYNPKSNPVERAHRDLGAMLRAILTEGGQDQWELALPRALFVLRTSPSATTGLAPYQVLFGRHAAQPLDHIFGLPPKTAPEAVNYPEYVDKLRARIDAAQQYARRHIRGAVQRRRGNYHAQKKLFQEGEWVWLFTPRTRQGESRKLTRYWTGPWEILARVNELVVKIQPAGSWAFQRGPEVVTVDRLKPYQGQTTIVPDPDDDLGMEEDEFAVGPFAAAGGPNDAPSGEGLGAPIATGPPNEGPDGDPGPGAPPPTDPPEDNGDGTIKTEGPGPEDDHVPPTGEGPGAPTPTPVRIPLLPSRGAAPDPPLVPDEPDGPPGEPAPPLVPPRRPRLDRAAKKGARYTDSRIPQGPLTRDEHWLVDTNARDQLARELYRSATGDEWESPDTSRNSTRVPTPAPRRGSGPGTLVCRPMKEATDRYLAASRRTAAAGAAAGAARAGGPRTATRLQPDRAAKRAAPQGRPRWR